MKKTLVPAAIFTILFFLGGCAKQNIPPDAGTFQKQPEQAEPVISDKHCREDGDCACGRRVGTGECFFGNVKYVDPNLKPCPDFCSGIDGKMKIRCAENECKQSRN